MVSSQRTIRHGFSEVKQDVLHRHVTAVLDGQCSLKCLTGEGEQLVELQLDGDDDIIVAVDCHYGTVTWQNGFAVIANGCKSLNDAGFRFVTAFPCVLSQPYDGASLVTFLFTGVAYSNETGLLWTKVKYDRCKRFPTEAFNLWHAECQVACFDKSAVGQCHLHVDVFTYGHLAYLQSAWRRDGDLWGRHSHLECGFSHYLVAIAFLCFYHLVFNVDAIA